MEIISIIISNFFLFPQTSPKNPCQDLSNIEYSESALIKLGECSLLVQFLVVDSGFWVLGSTCVETVKTLGP